MTRIEKILRKRLIRIHCFNRRPKDKELFSCLKILLKKYKNVFLDEELKTLHIFDVTNKHMFQIKRTSGEFGWNLKWIDTKQIVWLNSYYKSFSSVLIRMKRL